MEWRGKSDRWGAVKAWVTHLGVGGSLSGSGRVEMRGNEGGTRS